MLNDYSSFKFGLGMKQDDEDELSDEDGGAQANEDGLEREDDDYFRGALASSFAIGCQQSDPMEDFKQDYRQYEEVKGQQPISAQADLNHARETYLTRCKQVGRLGPTKTELDRSSMHGEALFGRERNMDFGPALDLDIEAQSNFVSIRANTAVFKDCFYYEVTLMTDGLMQIGWCCRNTSFDSSNGVGDSQDSYSYDGYRVEKWNQEHSHFG